MNAIIIATLLIFNNQNNWNHGISSDDIRIYFDDYEQVVQTRPPEPQNVDLIFYY